MYLSFVPTGIFKVALIYVCASNVVSSMAIGSNPFMVMFFNRGQLVKTELCSMLYLSPMNTMLAGIVIDSKDVQSIKAIVPILANPCGKITLLSEVHPWNTPHP